MRRDRSRQEPASARCGLPRATAARVPRRGQPARHNLPGHAQAGGALTMPATNHDQHTRRKLATDLAINVQIQRRKASRKGTKRTEKRAEEITPKARGREDARRNK